MADGPNKPDYIKFAHVYKSFDDLAVLVDNHAAAAEVVAYLAALGHPIAGDVEYGGRKPGDPDRPMLHAWRLRLRHPRTQADMTFEARPPADFDAFWASQR